MATSGCRRRSSSFITGTVMASMESCSTPTTTHVKVLGVKTGKLAEPSRKNRSLSLQTRIVGIDGKPVDRSLVTFWKAITEKELKTLLKNSMLRNERPQVWRDSVTGKRWRPIQNVACGDQATIEKLTPGEYRVTAHLSHDEPTSVVTSDVIRLDGSRKQTKVTLKSPKGPSLVVKVIDQKTAKAVYLPALVPTVCRWCHGAMVIGTYEGTKKVFALSSILPRVNILWK